MYFAKFLDIYSWGWVNTILIFLLCCKIKAIYEKAHLSVLIPKKGFHVKTAFMCSLMAISSVKIHCPAENKMQQHLYNRNLEHCKLCPLSNK